MKKTPLKIFIISTAALLNASCSVFGIRNEEQPNYRVVLKDKNKEIRAYPKQLVARTTVQGSYKEAQSKGFKILAGFIFGENKASKKIAMTAPVVQKEKKDESVKISMTAPVLLEPNEKNKSDRRESWTMTFNMPNKFSMKTLPKPTNPDVIIEENQPKLVAALVYSGLWSKGRNNKESEKLISWLEKNQNYKVISAPMFAGYDPPWTLPFLRRNEALVEVESVK